jgi:hypothetical protein
MAIPWKIMHRNGLKAENLTPMKAIRCKCLECSAWSSSEVRSCSMRDCPLYPYRAGKKPKNIKVI